MKNQSILSILGLVAIASSFVKAEVFYNYANAKIGSVNYVNDGNKVTYRAQEINGGLQIDVNNEIYFYEPRTTNGQWNIQIYGKPALLQYDNGNIIVELEDGQLFAKTESGILTGNRYSYVNRHSNVRSSSTGSFDSHRERAQEEPYRNGPQVTNHIIQNGQFGSSSTSFIGGNSISINIVNGGLQLILNGNQYNFPPKSGNSKERINLNGVPALLEYDNGNIIIELDDGTLVAKTEMGMLTGTRASYTNRVNIANKVKEDTQRIQQETMGIFESIKNKFSHFG